MLYHTITRLKISRRELLLIAFVFSAVGMLCAPLAVGRMLAMDDLKNYIIPFRWFFADSLQSGESYLWLPSIWCGYYIFAEFAGTAHPVIIVLYRFLEFSTAFTLEYGLCYFLMAYGMFLWVHIVVKLDNISSWVSGILYAFMGFNLHHYVHTPFLLAGAHLPFLLLAIDGVIRSHRARTVSLYGIALSILTASEVLSSHAQMLWVLGLCEAAYVVLAAFNTPHVRSRLLVLVFAKTLGVLGGGVQLIPCLEVHGQSHRSRISREFQATGSIPPLSWLVQSFSPYLYNSRVMAPPTTVLLPPVGLIQMGPAVDLNDWRAWEFGIYNGAIVPPLLAWLLIRWRALAGRQKQIAWISLILATMALMLSFGNYTPLFDLTSRIPPFNMFRAPGRYRIIYSFAVSVLVAISLSDLTEARTHLEHCPYRRLWPLAFVGILSLGITILPKILYRWFPVPFLAEALSYENLYIIGGTSLVVGIAGFVCLAARGFKWAIDGILIVTLLDISMYATTYIYNSPVLPFSELSRFDVPPLEAMPWRFSQGDGFDHRISVGQKQFFESNAPLISGIKYTEGYTAMQPTRTLDYAALSTLRVAGADWVHEHSSDGEIWRSVPNPLPRVRLVTSAVVSSDPAMDIEKIDVETTALVEATVGLSGGKPGSAILVSDRPGRITVNTDTQTTQLVVLSERFTEGWKVAVDGHEQKVLRVNGDFQGCLVEAGRHTIQFTFNPRSFAIGLILTIIATSAMIVWFAITIRIRAGLTTDVINQQ